VVVVVEVGTREPDQAMLLLAEVVVAVLGTLPGHQQVQPLLNLYKTVFQDNTVTELPEHPVQEM
jgi:hypothetical protein